MTTEEERIDRLISLAGRGGPDGAAVVLEAVKEGGLQIERRCVVEICRQLGGDCYEQRVRACVEELLRYPPAVRREILEAAIAASRGGLDAPCSFTVTSVC
ncbi:MAG: hypothetical protein FJ280_19355 [Planctomycetes bacterium]|nr:hypothetical protein [Planctomycetota bacterium]